MAAGSRSGSNGSVTNKDLYEAVNGMRVELKGDIKDLRSQFDNLEAGRLTRAEGDINHLRVELQKAINQFAIKDNTISGRVALIWGLGGAIIIAVLTAVAYRVIVVGATSK